MAGIYCVNAGTKEQTSNGYVTAPVFPDPLTFQGASYYMSKVTPYLMFNNQLEAAIAFYTATVPSLFYNVTKAQLALACGTP